MNMIKLKVNALIINAFLLLIMVTVMDMSVQENVLAANMEFNLEQYNAYIEQNSNSSSGMTSNELLSDVQNVGTDVIAAALDIGFDILALLFIFGVIGIGAGFTLQNGQWTKWSTGAMYGTFLAIIFLRVVPILVLTIDQIGFTLVINHVIQLFVSIGFFIAILMFIIGLFLRSLNKIFEHPKYFRWGRSLLFGSVIIMTLSVFSPFIIMSL